MKHLIPPQLENDESFKKLVDLLFKGLEETRQELATFRKHQAAMTASVQVLEEKKGSLDQLFALYEQIVAEKAPDWERPSLAELSGLNEAKEELEQSEAKLAEISSKVDEMRQFISGDAASMGAATVLQGMFSDMLGGLGKGRSSAVSGVLGNVQRFKSFDKDHPIHRFQGTQLPNSDKQDE